MKNRYFKALTILSLAFAVLSCDNDFSVSDDWEDVTVIYSLLDPAADTNWVRVERGYLGNAVASASYNIPDSLYYDSLVVFLYELDAQGNQVDSLYLERDNTSRGRGPGVFTSSEYRIYRTAEPINEESTYRIYVKKTNSKFIDASGITEIVGGQIPGNNFDFGFNVPRDIVNAPSEFLGKVEIDPSDRATIYQVYFTFKYKEYDLQTKTSVNKSIYFQYASLEGEGATSVGEITFNTPFSSFLSSIAEQVPADRTKLRFVEEMVIDVYAGGSNLQKYMALNAPTAGINQNKPEFPGIENGTGLFSSRTKITLEDVDFPRSNLGGGPYTTFYNQFYLSGILCERNFVKVSSNDTLICDLDPNGNLVGKHYSD